MDWPTMAAVGVLLVMGLIAVFSAVSPSGASTRFMFKQLLAIGLGVIAIFILSSLNYQIFRAYPWILYGLTLLVFSRFLSWAGASMAPRAGSCSGRFPLSLSRSRALVLSSSSRRSWIILNER